MDVILTKECIALDSKNQKNFAMDSNYKETDEDLYKFRDKITADNEDIKRFFFQNKDKINFKIDLFNYNTISDAVYNIITVNSNQQKLKLLSKVDSREFEVLSNCLSCGLMGVDKNIISETIHSYGYDYPKYYYHMMRKIRIPLSKPKYNVLDDLNFDQLEFGIYRVKIICNNKQFWNIFKFNSKHHYLYSTLKALYKMKDKFNIEFNLLDVDKNYNYNCVTYDETIELKTLFKDWFKICDKLLRDCDKDNKLIKTYVSQAWGTISKYKKIYVDNEEISEYDFGHLDKIDKEQHEYYHYDTKNEIHTLIKADDPFSYKGLGRVKTFLSKFSRNYIFNMLTSNNLAKYVIRIQTDSISFTKPIDFNKLNLDYFPISEGKTTGLITYYNVNCYRHWC